MGDYIAFLYWDRVYAGAFDASHSFFFLFSGSAHVEVANRFNAVIVIRNKRVDKPEAAAGTGGKIRTTSVRRVSSSLSLSNMLFDFRS